MHFCKGANRKNQHEAHVIQPTTGRYRSGDFVFLIEFLRDYPLSPPNVWLISPDPEKKTFPTLYVDGKIAYLGPNDWSSQYTSYDVETNDKVMDILLLQMATHRHMGRHTVLCSISTPK